MIAQVWCDVSLAQENVVRIYGTEGWLLVPSPYVVTRSLANEALAAPCRRVCARNDDRRTLGNMTVIDAWLRQVGVIYS